MKVMCIKPDGIVWQAHDGPQFGDEVEVVKVVKGIGISSNKAKVGYHFFEWPWELYPVAYSAEYFVQIDTGIEEEQLELVERFPTLKSAASRRRVKKDIDAWKEAIRKSSI